MANLSFQTSGGNSFNLPFGYEQMTNGNYVDCYAEYEQSQHRVVSLSLEEGYVLIGPPQFVVTSQWGNGRYEERFDSKLPLGHIVTIATLEDLRYTFNLLIQNDNLINESKNNVELNWIMKYFTDSYLKVGSLRTSTYFDI